MQQLTDSGVELVARPFAKAEDVGSLQAEIVKRVKTEFNRAGVVIPHRHQEIRPYAQPQGTPGDPDEGEAEP